MRFLTAIVILIVSVGSLLTLGHRQLVIWSGRPLILNQAVIVDFPRGTSLKQLSTSLKDQNVIDHDLVFQTWVRMFADFRKFQAGSYLFEGAVTPAMIIEKVSTGDTYQPVVLEFTVPEGFTLRQVIARLEAKGVGTNDQLWTAAKNKSLLSKYGVQSTSAEGYFYPVTYQFAEQPTPDQVIEEALKTFKSKLPDDYERLASLRGLNLHQAVTFASLIEHETAHRHEKPMVAEVIWRRLAANEPLGIDASLIYGITDYDGNLTRKHLQDTENPFNTRVHAGLPPGPICSPSRGSLEAVLNPTNEGYYYYVADPASGTQHHFSKTAEEHNQWVKKLVAHERKSP